MDIIESEAAVNLLNNELHKLKELISRLETERSNLPRSDKKGSAELLHKIVKAKNQLKANRVQLASVRGVYEKKLTHSLWEQAVFNLYGQDGLTACRSQMRSERIKREAENA